MDFQEAQNQIKTIIRKYLPEDKYKAFIFGSRATGENLKWSDIDVGIEGKEPIPIMTKVDIEEKLENSDIPYIVDLVDFSHTSGKFRELALKHTIPL